MDRKILSTTLLIMPMVALRKESVDRKLIGCIDRVINIMSLSARRAWIENAGIAFVPFVNGSLSARRAWIEKLIFYVKFVCSAGRSPQGERG